MFFGNAQKPKETKNISVDDILILLDGPDIDLLGTDNEYKEDNIEYVLKTTKLASDSELGSSDTDELNAIPSTSTSTLAKQPKGKKEEITECYGYSFSN